MDRLFEQFFGDSAPEGNGANPETFYLPVDVFESEDAYTLVASASGFSQEQVEITFEDGGKQMRGKVTQ